MPQKLLVSDGSLSPFVVRSVTLDSPKSDTLQQRDVLGCDQGVTAHACECTGTPMDTKTIVQAEAADTTYSQMNSEEIERKTQEQNRKKFASRSPLKCDQTHFGIANSRQRLTNLRQR